jgi:hypothetical protein
VDIAPEVAHDREVLVEDAEVMPVGGPRKRRRDGRRLAAVCRQKKKDQNLDAGRPRNGQERAQRKDGCRRNVVATRRGANHSVRRRILLTKDTTREYCGSRKGLVAARRGTTRRAVVARRRTLFTKTTRSRLIVSAREVPRHATVARRRRDATKEERDDAKRAPRDRTPGKRRRVNPEGKTTMRDPVARRQLPLRNVKTAGRLCRGNHEDVIGPKIAKRTARSYARMRTKRDWTLWRGRPPPKRKK